MFFRHVLCHKRFAATGAGTEVALSGYHTEKMCIRNPGTSPEGGTKKFQGRGGRSDSFLPYLTARLKLLPSVRGSPPWRAPLDAHPLSRDNPMIQMEQSVAMERTGLLPGVSLAPTRP